MFAEFGLGGFAVDVDVDPDGVLVPPGLVDPPGLVEPVGFVVDGVGVAVGGTEN